jgi:uncharacterized protein YndB with AHSA1/START domain
MSNKLEIRKETLFSGTPTQVWNIITNPTLTEQYMFGCAVESTWELGADVIWKGKDMAGKDLVYVTGKIVAITPLESITFTMFAPNTGIADIPENYVTLTYKLSSISPSQTELVLEQGDFATVENGVERFEQSKAGWDVVWPKMQALLEFQ